MKKNLILIALASLSACNAATTSSFEDREGQFHRDMEKASRFCLEKGLPGHSPEYRGCTIKKASQIINERSANKLFF